MKSEIVEYAVSRNFKLSIMMIIWLNHHHQCFLPEGRSFIPSARNLGCSSTKGRSSSANSGIADKSKKPTLLQCTIFNINFFNHSTGYPPYCICWHSTTYFVYPSNCVPEHDASLCTNCLSSLNWMCTFCIQFDNLQNLFIYDKITTKKYGILIML